jgi:hypothetical protein
MPNRELSNVGSIDKKPLIVFCLLIRRLSLNHWQVASKPCTFKSERRGVAAGESEIADRQSA